MRDYLSDADSTVDVDTMFPQHQSAITLMHELLDTPSLDDFYWLDLQCGEGQILVHFKEHFSDKIRKKITYCPYDINIDFLGMACSRAKSLNFKDVVEQVGNMCEFKRNCHCGPYDFITIIKGFHEINPFHYPILIADCLSLLKDKGILYIFDIEKQTSPELGALYIKRNEIEKVVNSFIAGLGIQNYYLEVPKWPAKDSPSWSLILKKENFNAAFEKPDIVKTAVEEGEKTIMNILKSRLAECYDILDAITIGVHETSVDRGTKIQYLFEFFALNRNIGDHHE